MDTTTRGRPRKPEGTHYKTYNFTLPPSLVEQVQEKALSQHTAVSQIIRDLLIEWLSE